MAFPVVASSALSSRDSDAADDVITMPSGITAGDLLVIFHATDVNAISRTWSGGFVELHDAVATAGMGVAYKIAVGGDSCTVTKGDTEKFSAIALRITGAHATQAPELGTVATGTSTGPNAGSVTASWGGEDNLFITWHSHVTGAADTTITTWPASYTDNQLEGTWLTTCGEPNLATRDLAAASDDAGAWLISASRGWRAGTLVIRPGAAAAATPQRTLMGVGR